MRAACRNSRRCCSDSAAEKQKLSAARSRYRYKRDLGLGADEDYTITTMMLGLVLTPGGTRQTSLLRSMSIGRNWQTSPGRQPVNRCSLTMSATVGGMYGRVAATTASSTGRIGPGSRAVVRPL